MPWLTGFPREKVDWSPTINPEACLKCGICMNCGREVFRWTGDGPRVENPAKCVVGCSTCANLCMGEAISFPDLAALRSLYKKENIWSRVREKLIEEGKIW